MNIVDVLAIMPYYVSLFLITEDLTPGKKDQGGNDARGSCTQTQVVFVRPQIRYWKLFHRQNIRVFWLSLKMWRNQTKFREHMAVFY